MQENAPRFMPGPAFNLKTERRGTKWQGMGLQSSSWWFDSIPRLQDILLLGGCLRAGGVAIPGRTALLACVAHRRVRPLVIFWQARSELSFGVKNNRPGEEARAWTLIVSGNRYQLVKKIYSLTGEAKHSHNYNARMVQRGAHKVN
jgi:hypothetical protein